MTRTPSHASALERGFAERTGLSFAGSRGDWLRSLMQSAFGDDGGHDGGSESVEAERFDRLCDALTVQESYFFREPAALELVRQYVVPALRLAGRQARVWSAGCANGEEAYTLAMLLTEAGLGMRHRVLGTDLSGAAVTAARRGCYARWSLRQCDPDTVDRCFALDGDVYRVKDRFRHCVHFRRHNILEPLPTGSGSFDLVLCRNVLIYLTPQAAERAVRRLVDVLAPGGWLILGVSDPVLPEHPGLIRHVTEHGLAYRRPAPGSDVAVATSTSEAPSAPPDDPRRRPNGQGRRTPPLPAPADSARLVIAARRALELGSPRQAERLARSALSASSRGGRAARLSLIQALAADGRLEEAIAEASRAVDELPGDAEIRHLHAAILLEAGDVTEATVAARKALYLDPGLLLAHLVLARAHELAGDHAAADRARRNGHRLLAEATR